MSSTKRPQVRADLGLMEGYHSPQVPVEVRLNTNESPFPPPPEFSERLAAEVVNVAWHRYPERSASALRTGIAALHDVKPGQVFAANGSNEVLQTLLLAYAGPGRSVATFEPTYALHSHIARITGATVVEGDRGKDFELRLDEAERVLDQHKPAVLFLCSPNNPTGLLEPPELVRTLAQRAADDGFVLVVDEAYGQFSPWSALELLHDDLPLVVSRTYSKTWSMAAARLGYLVGPTWLVDELEKVVLPYHLDVVTQLAGTLALDYAPEMSERVAVIVEERGRIQAALAELPVRAWPSAANFLLFRPEGGSGEAVWQGLVERSVLVRNCASWPRLEDCLRVTVGTRDENDAFLAALKEVLS
ncbi:MAG: histidinol-phosphate aminotransferase [Acidimicrobiia bacterium]|jgi:histidinol-phosphate aminotransferase|nr:histidinol-phosphate aminotransferase [Acidimicrobiia bacterium]